MKDLCDETKHPLESVGVLGWPTPRGGERYQLFYS